MTAVQRYDPLSECIYTGYTLGCISIAHFRNVALRTYMVPDPTIIFTANMKSKAYRTVHMYMHGDKQRNSW